MPMILLGRIEADDVVTVRLLRDAELGPIGIITLPVGAYDDGHLKGAYVEAEIIPTGAPASEAVAYGQAMADQIGWDLVIIGDLGRGTLLGAI